MQSGQVARNDKNAYPDSDPAGGTEFTAVANTAIGFWWRPFLEQTRRNAASLARLTRAFGRSGRLANRPWNKASGPSLTGRRRLKILCPCPSRLGGRDGKGAERSPAKRSGWRGRSA